MNKKTLISLLFLSVAIYLKISKSKSISHLWWYRLFVKDVKKTLNKKITHIGVIDSLEKKEKDNYIVVVSFYTNNTYYLYNSIYDSNKTQISYTIDEIDYNKAHFWNEDSYLGLC